MLENLRPCSSTNRWYYFFFENKLSHLKFWCHFLFHVTLSLANLQPESKAAPTESPGSQKYAIIENSFFFFLFFELIHWNNVLSRLIFWGYFLLHIALALVLFDLSSLCKLRRVASLILLSFQLNRFTPSLWLLLQSLISPPGSLSVLVDGPSFSHFKT